MSACSERVKTCQTCARAKIRCMRSPGETICDRCLRLNKQCYFRPARMRQAWAKKESRLESLERRVEELLGQSHGSCSQHSDPDPPVARKTSIGNDVIDKGIVSLDQAAALLDTFRRFMMPHFPFVVVDSHITASELREQKPFLFLTILSVSEMRDTDLQRTLDKETAAVLSKRTVTDLSNKASLETLQGILVAIAWGQHQPGPKGSDRVGPRDFSNYLHLAISLVVELELDRPVELRKRCPRMTIDTVTPIARPIHILRDEQRAVIGCSFLSSIASIITQKTCTFPWSTRLESFALELSEKAEYPSDRSLIHLVQLQHIFEQIDHLSADPNIPLAGYTSHFGDADSFLQMFRVLHSQLQDYTAQLSPHFTSNNFILAAQLHTVNLYLCQVSLFEKGASAQLPYAVRVDMLCHGLASAKNSFDSLLTVALNTERYMSYTQWLETGFCLILSCKLALMAASDKAMRQNEPRVQALCDNLDMIRILDTCVSRQISHQPDRKTGFDYTSWLQWIQEWFEKHYYAYTARDKGSQGQVAVEHTVVLAQHPPHSAPFTADDDLGISVTPEELLPWPGFPDVLPSDNVLGGWMDLGVISL
ncbi:hypothetical protein BJY01DRAFT_190447 [Aspergillus pseudoustus]|uniref:Zn(2)-C6 fungal-type domain-containing protein n=1 Tax=Aspergillus pseudoustus TaxID=1810923 RepID=A0ABR4JVI5_9EURO